jgi:hypothetical protein
MLRRAEPLRRGLGASRRVLTGLLQVVADRARRSTSIGASPPVGVNGPWERRDCLPGERSAASWSATSVRYQPPATNAVERAFAAGPGSSPGTYAVRVPLADHTHVVVYGETLFHFTHVKNLASIVRSGKLLSDSAAQAAGCISVEVGDRYVKSRRREMAVGVGTGGCPADYFPFYFAPRSPMLYVISKGQVPEYREGQDPLVYLVTDVASVIATGRPWAYSDGNCASVLTEYSTDLSDMASLVDWDVERHSF